MFLVLLNLTAAFDTVNHDILFDRVEKEIGLTGTALKWFKLYFSGRTTSVCVNGRPTMSVNHDLEYGLPQGSTVGPLSFFRVCLHNTNGENHSTPWLVLPSVCR